MDPALLERLFYLSVGVILAGLALSGLLRAVGVWRTSRLRLEERRLEPGVVAAVQSGDALDLSGLRWPQSSLRWKAVEAILIRYASAPPAGRRRRLAQIFDGLGYVEFYLKRLKSKIPAVRLDAANRLGLMTSSRAVPELLSVMASEDRPLRREAMLALARIGEPRSIGPAVRIACRLGFPERGLSRTILIEVVLPFQSRAVKPLLRLLSDPSDRVRATAADLLGWVPRYKAVGPLIRCLKDQSPHVRARAAFALGRIGHPLAAGGVVALLSDPSWTVRLEAARAVGLLGAAQGIHGLTLLLRDLHPQVRHAAARALNRVGPAGTRAMAVHLLYNKDRFAREQVALALGESGFVMRRVEELSSPDPVVRREAVDLLRGILRAAGWPALLKALETHPNPEIRLRLIEILSESDRLAVWRVIRRVSLFDRDRAVRELAKDTVLRFAWQRKGRTGLGYFWRRPRLL